MLDFLSSFPARNLPCDFPEQIQHEARLQASAVASMVLGLNWEFVMDMHIAIILTLLGKKPMICLGFLFKGLR